MRRLRASGTYRIARAVALPLLLAGALAACGQGKEKPVAAPRRAANDLPTEEVAPPPDAKVDVTQDRQEHRRVETFSGVLPSGFPRELPLPSQASLVDQGRRWVEVLVPRHPADVQDPYLGQLRHAGWTVDSTAAHAWTLARAGRSVRLTLRPQGPSTRLHIAY